MNDFEKGFTTAFIGYMIGAWIDNTRFGYWLNNSPVMDTVADIVRSFLLTLALLVGIIFLVMCVIVFFG